MVIVNRSQKLPPKCAPVEGTHQTFSRNKKDKLFRLTTAQEGKARSGDSVPDLSRFFGKGSSHSRPDQTEREKQLIRSANAFW